MELFTGQPAYQHLIQKPVLEVIQRMFKAQISDLDASFEGYSTPFSLESILLNFYSPSQTLV